MYVLGDESSFDNPPDLTNIYRGRIASDGTRRLD
jgi:hypothetical protein